MNIVCENCNTVYRFDASKIPPGGKKVKCSNCQHIFMAMPSNEDAAIRTLDPDSDPGGEPLDVDAAPVEEEAQAAGGSPEDEEKKRRLLLRQDGTRYAVADLATLQRWIVERRVTRDAELSEDGEVWEKVGERMDLLPFFSIVERSRNKKKGAARTGEAAAPDSPAPGPREKKEKPIRPGREEAAVKGLRVATTLQATAETEIPTGNEQGDSEAREGDSDAGLATASHPGRSMSEDDRPAALIAMNRSSGEAAGASIPAASQPADVAYAAPSSGSFARVMYGLGVACLVGGLAYAFFFKPDQKSTPVTPVAGVVDSASDRGASGPASGGSAAGSAGSPAAPGMPVGTGSSSAALPDAQQPPGGTASAGSEAAAPSAGSAAQPPEAVGAASPQNPAGQPLVGGSGPAPGAPAEKDVVPPRHEIDGGAVKIAAGSNSSGAASGASAPARPAEAAHVSVAEPASAPPAASTGAAPHEGNRPAPAAPSLSRAERLAMTAPAGSVGKLIQSGKTYIRQHRFEDAVNTFRKATQQAPTNAIAHKELGWALLNLAEVSYATENDLRKEALREFDRAIELNSKYAEVYHLRGVTYMSMGSNADAVKNFKQALSYGLKGDDATEAHAFLQKLEADGAGSN